ncbi:MAG: PDDEXK nuclease domain-containing protein, partial [Pseudanabaena sp.]
MRAFAEDWTDEQIVQQVAAQIPWFHNCILLDKVKPKPERIWYIQETITNGWSRAVLKHQIETKLYQRQGKTINNFYLTLPQSQSDLAQQLMTDPYTFDFLTLAQKAQERDLEKALLERIRSFLLELGTGFAIRLMTASQALSEEVKNSKAIFIPRQNLFPVECKTVEGTVIAGQYSSYNVNKLFQNIQAGELLFVEVTSSELAPQVTARIVHSNSGGVLATV